MITTNLLQFVLHLNALGLVKVHDRSETIEVQVTQPANVQAMDDLVCDALFVDPLHRSQNSDGWTLHLMKRDNLRPAGDLDVVNGSTYVVRPAA